MMIFVYVPITNAVSEVERDAPCWSSSDLSFLVVRKITMCDVWLAAWGAERAAGWLHFVCCELKLVVALRMGPSGGEAPTSACLTHGPTRVATRPLPSAEAPPGSRGTRPRAVSLEVFERLHGQINVELRPVRI